HVRTFAPAPGTPKATPPRPPGQGVARGGVAPAPATPKAAPPASSHERNQSLEEEVRELQAHSRRLDEEVRELQAHSRRLDEEVRELQSQEHKPSDVPPGGAPSQPSESRQHEVARPSAPSAPAAPASRELFRQRCVKCHGADGTGSSARDRL